MTTRVTLTLPIEIARRLRKRPNKSAFVAAALREHLEREDAVRRASRLAVAYAAAAKEDAALRADWESTVRLRRGQRLRVELKDLNSSLPGLTTAGLREKPNRP